MKKVVVLSLILLLVSIGCYAAEGEVMKISAEDKVITVTVTGEIPETGKLTMLVVKDGSSAFADRIYSVSEITLQKDMTVQVQFEIPNTRRLTGESGAGDYTVYLNNKNGTTLATQTFSYATDDVVNSFLSGLKAKAAEVTDATKAYEKLGELMTSANAGVFFTIDLDFEQYQNATTAVQQQTLNLLYSNGVSTLTPEILSEIFKGAYGLASFMNGDYINGIDILSPEYNGVKITATNALLADTVAIMNRNYTTIGEFQTGFTTAYGIVTINNANKYGMEDALTVFQRETGVCTAEIQKIAGLISTLRNRAYEYMVASIASAKLTSATELQTLLTAAYNAATANGGNQGGSPSGGGFAGGGGGGGGAISGKGSPVDIVIDEKENPIVPTPQVEMVFTDLSIEHWAAESVQWLKKKGIVNGTDTGAFEPNRTVTREEFAKMLVLACGLDTQYADTEFADAEPGAWYRPFIGAAASHGIVNGIGENVFGVGQQITRQDMATMTHRALELTGSTITKNRDYIAFEDEPEISDYAIHAVKSLYEAGVINGRSEERFEPLGNATRAEAAKMIYEAIKGGI